MLIEELRPIIDVLQPALLKASIVVGGLFGLYIILIIVRIYYGRKMVSVLKDIRYNLDQANIEQGINYSKQRRPWWKKMYRKVRRTIIKK